MNSPSSASVTIRRSRLARRTLWLLIGGAPILLILIAAVVIVLRFQLQSRAAQTAIDAEIKRVEAAGEPITIDDLYAYHRVPSGKPDTTAAWLEVLKSVDETKIRAGRELPIIGIGDESLLRPDVPGSVATEVEQFLSQFDETLEGAHAAAKLKGECRIPFEFDDGILMSIGTMQQIRLLLYLEQLELRQRLYDHNTTGALESVDTILATGHILEHQVSITEQLVRLNVLSAALREAQLIVNHVQLSENQLAKLQNELQFFDLKESFTRGVLGDRAVIDDHVHGNPRLFETLQDEPVGKVIKLRGELYLGRLSARRFFLETMAELIEASRHPFPKALKRSAEIEDRVHALADAKNRLEQMKYSTALLVVPAVEVALIATATRTAERNLMVAAIAAERYRLEAGDHPDDLLQLVPKYLPAVPADPFDGQPLRLNKTEGELLLYSISEDGRDDEGGDEDIIVRIQTAKGKSVTP